MTEPSPPKSPQDAMREEAQRQHDRVEAFHRYVNEQSMKSGEFALRMSLLVNGGAAISLMALMAHLTIPERHRLANTLVWFASGVALAVSGLVFAYFTNYFMAGYASSLSRNWIPPFISDGPRTQSKRRLNFVFHCLAVAAGLASLAAFVRGIFHVRAALTQLAS